jgi:hypothetical protein
VRKGSASTIKRIRTLWYLSKHADLPNAHETDAGCPPRLGEHKEAGDIDEEYHSKLAKVHPESCRRKSSNLTVRGNQRLSALPEPVAKAGWGA